jgi:hypothetical protein
MVYQLGYNLSELSIEIMQILFKYRGMTAIQTAKLLYPEGYTVSQEKNIYNNLINLKKIKLVVSNPLQQGFSRGSMYYLTKIGLEFMNHWFNICPNHYGEGWINSDSRDFGDIDYELYKPPLAQETHHLLNIEFFIQLNKNDLCLDYRLNLYAAKTYFQDGKKFRFRPDAELKLPDGKSIMVEIDRGTEDHEQLRKKFSVYRNYFDYIKSNKSELPTAIVIVVEDRRRSHGIKRRWVNVLTAYLDEIASYHKDVNLIMMPLSKTQETLNFEINRDKYDQQAAENAQKLLNGFGYSKVHSIAQPGYTFSVASKKHNYDVYFNTVSQQYDSLVYSKYLDFKQKYLESIKQSGKKVNTILGDIQVNLFYQDDIPIVVDKIEHKLENEQWKNFFQDFNEMINFYKLSQNQR